MKSFSYGKHQFTQVYRNREIERSTHLALGYFDKDHHFKPGGIHFATWKCKGCGKTFTHNYQKNGPDPLVSLESGEIDKNVCVREDGNKALEGGVE